MISKTGNKAFTLIEVMAATAVLSLGVVFMYEAFLSSLDAYGYYNSYLAVSPFMDEKIWQSQDSLRRLANLGQAPQEGTVFLEGRNYNWSVSNEPLPGTPDLFKTGITVSWLQGKRKMELSRAAYAEYEKEEIK
ncbi:MAG: prepilin-type N-terminal cleavage/methylation domain-containing protein [Candidatus Omnitrophica bacterium]|nr:prepilin-type N-terminal cleavage/methylation domain-containing protein [Candidatus Omnitrophota bacterium]